MDAKNDDLGWRPEFHLPYPDESNLVNRIQRLHATVDGTALIARVEVE